MTLHPDRDGPPVLVYRTGSIGDFVVALPALHLIRRSLADRQIILLTNRPDDPRALPAWSVLDGTGLVDDYLLYPAGMKSPADWLELRCSVRGRGIDTMVYLLGTRPLASVIRDYLFFRGCGVGRFFGVPLRRASREPGLLPDGSGRWESESARLVRRVGRLKGSDVSPPDDWDLRLSSAELMAGERLIDLAQDAPRIGLAIGTKQPIKDWADQNWRSVLAALADRDLALVFFGGPEDRQRAAALAADWPGTIRNLCGRANPRESAAALLNVDFLVCVDSGPMHLAAAVGTPCVAIFSGKSRPGVWYPPGDGHCVLYPGFGASIETIQPEAVIGATKHLGRQTSKEQPKLAGALG